MTYIKGETVRKCQNSKCGTDFVANAPHQAYCQRSCFKKSLRMKKAALHPRFPSFRCGACGKLTTLDYDPKIGIGKAAWEEAACPSCGTKVGS